MQSKSAIILGVSFAIGMAIYGVILNLSSWFASELVDSRYSSLSVSVSKKVDLAVGESVKPEIIAELYAQAQEQAEAFAMASGVTLDGIDNAYVSRPDYYDSGEEEAATKKTRIEFSVSYRLK
ncbi:MAG: hypothetical protein LBP89_00135 [Helicobacteraceae bacterium]|jgi:hypothetical protein|nr:hypothetical protein [Helicobacteraceae bacterium]